MSRRMELLYLSAFPAAVVIVLILELLDLTESGLAAALLLATWAFAGIWFLDPPEVGWGRRARRQRKQREAR